VNIGIIRNREAMRRRYTRWMPLGHFTYSGTDYIVMVKKNLKTGMLKFKNISVNYRTGSACYPILPLGLINTKDAWEEINKT